MVNFSEIKKIFEFVTNNANSYFYKKKYSGFGKLEESNFNELPFLTREELQSIPVRSRIFVPAGEIDFVAYSSGTTSNKPLITYYSNIENYRFNPSLGLGVKKIFFIFPPINRHFSHTLVQQCLESGSGAYPIFGDFVNLSNSAVIAKECEIDSIYSTPTLAFLFHEQLTKYYDVGRIKLVGLCGEALSDARRAQLQEIYPNAKIVNLYAASEIGQFILYPCSELIDKNLELFHPQEPLLAAELIDGGELVLTYAANKAMPLIRYRTGDMFEAADPQCGCGKETLRWLGRVNSDIIRIAGLEFKVSDLEEALRPISDLVGDSYQLHFYQNKSGDSIVTDLIIELAMLQNEVIESRVLDRVINYWRLSSSATLNDAIGRGLISKPVVRFVEEFSMKTEKRRKLINHI